MTSHFRLVSLALLVAFLAGIGPWSIAAKAFAHGLGHQIESVDVVPAGDGEEQEGSGGDADHGFLHAMGHLQAAALSTAQGDAQAPQQPLRFTFIVPAVDHSTGEAPFRPPRGHIPA